ncbi:Wzz/FepE/Etk N-terminal domain-containing protein, partial [Caballeronia mineralivorans]
MAINFENRYADVVSTGDELRLSDYLAAILGSWRIIVMVTLAVVVLGTAYAFLAPPVYRADAMIQVTESNPANNANNNNANAVQTVSQMFDAKSTTAAEIELLRSRLVVEDTVNRLHLDIAARPRYFPIVGGMISDILGTRNGQA